MQMARKIDAKTARNLNTNRQGAAWFTFAPNGQLVWWSYVK